MILKIGGLKVLVKRYDVDRFVIAADGGAFVFWHIYRTPRAFFGAVRRRLEHALLFLQLWPVYFEVFSRDCDLVESTRLVKAPCFFIGYRELRKAAEEWTEGPFGFRQLSRAEAKAFRPHWRDRIGEAFDDGNHTRIIL